jgi:hypothetical protein
MSKSAIAEKLSMSRNTVARLVALAEPPKYERAPAGSQLDPFAEQMAPKIRRSEGPKIRRSEDPKVRRSRRR